MINANNVGSYEFVHIFKGKAFFYPSTFQCNELSTGFASLFEAKTSKSY